MDTDQKTKADVHSVPVWRDEDCQVCQAGRSLDPGDAVIAIGTIPMCETCVYETLQGDHDLTDDAVEAVRAELGDKGAA